MRGIIRIRMIKTRKKIKEIEREIDKILLKEVEKKARFVKQAYKGDPKPVGYWPEG